MTTPAGAVGGDGGAGGAAEAAAADGVASDAQGDPFARPHLTARERAILTYADRVTLAPASMTEAHLEPMREAGLDDRAIHDVCAITAYFAFVNRMADGLGVELEGDREWKDGRGSDPEPGGS